MLDFKWVQDLNSVNMYLNDGTSLEWNCKTWRKSKIKELVIYDENDDFISPDIFHSLNEYLATLDSEILTKLSEAYKSAFIALDSIHNNIPFLDKRLNEQINIIFTLIDFEDLHKWCLDNNKLAFEIGVKDTLSSKDFAAETYFTEDYENLLVFTVWIKLILPIWGSYYNVAIFALGPKIVLLRALELLRGGVIETNPAFLRLMKQVEILVGKRMKGNGFAITNEFGTDELIDYMMALMLWKKVVIFDPKAKARSIIRYIFNLINDQCERCNKSEPRQKKSTNATGDETSAADMYAIINPLPPGIPIAINCSIKHLHERLNIPLEQVVEMDGLINIKGLTILSLHIPIISAVVGKYIGVRSVEIVPTNLRLLAIVICWLQNNNFLTLMELLMLVPEEKDLSILNSGFVLLPITKEQTDELTEIYRLVYPYQPWAIWSDTIIREVNQYSWNFRMGSLEGILRELIDLLLYFNRR